MDTSSQLPISLCTMIIKDGIIAKLEFRRADYNQYDGKHFLVKYTVISDPNGVFKPGDPIWLKEIPDKDQLQMDV